MTYLLFLVFLSVFLDKIVYNIRMNKEISKILYNAGLSEKQADVYSYLLKNGASSPSVIAERTNITRPSIYRILLELSIKGLVDETQQNKKKLFFISSVDKLSNWKKDNIKFVNRQSELIEKNLPNLRNLLLSNENSIQVRYFNDIEALHKIYDDHLEYANYEMIGFSDIEKITEFLGEDFLRKYVTKKKKSNIRSRGIIPISTFGKEYKEDFYGKHAYNEQVQIRMIDGSKYPIGYGTEIVLYANKKISMIDVSQKTLSGVIIENESLYMTLKSIFEMTWVNLTV